MLLRFEVPDDLWSDFWGCVPSVSSGRLFAEGSPPPGAGETVGAGAIVPSARTSGLSTTRLVRGVRKLYVRDKLVACLVWSSLPLLVLLSNLDRKPSLTLRKPHTRSTKSLAISSKVTSNFCGISEVEGLPLPASATVAAFTCFSVSI